ncbi:MAG: M16 family metallopeptidase [Candidatus Binataceae bacterium]
MATFEAALRVEGASLDARLARLGAAIRGRVEPDGTIVAMSALTWSLPRALALYAQALANPQFHLRDFARVRAAQAELISRELCNPNNLALRLLPRMLYPAGHHDGSQRGYGSGRTNAILTPEDLRKYFAEHLSPTCATLIVAGGPGCKEMRALLEDSFGRWNDTSSRIQPHPVKRRQLTASPGVGEGPDVILIDLPGAKQAVLYMGLRVPRRESTLAIVIDAVFARMFTSRLNLKLRETKGWTYGIRSWLSQTRDDTQWIISCSVHQDRTTESMREVLETLEGLAFHAPCGEEELRGAINYLVGHNYSHFETCADTADALANSVLLDQPIDYVWNSPARLRKSRTAQVADSCKRILAAHNPCWIVVGNAAELVDRLYKAGHGHIKIISGQGIPS